MTDNKDLTQKEHAWSGQALKSLLWIAAVAAVYAVTAWLSLQFVIKPQGIAAIWPTEGIFLSALLLTRRGLRPYLAAVLFVDDFIFEMISGSPFALSSIYAFVLACDAFLSSWLLTRFFGEKPDFGGVRQVVGFLFFSVFLCNAGASIAAASASAVITGTDFWFSLKWWFTSDGVGNILVTPLILSWASGPGVKIRALFTRRTIEAAALLLVMSAASYFTFGYFSFENRFGFLLNYLTFPFLIWAAIRFGPRGASFAMILLAGIAIRFTLSSNMFGESSALDAILAIQVYLAVTSVSTIILASIVSERARVEESLRQSEERFRKIFEESCLGMVIADRNFFFIRANAAFCGIIGYSEEELSTRTFKDITHPRHLTGDIDNVMSLLQGRISVYKTEKRYVRKDGGIVWGSATITAIRNNRGDFLYFLSMIEDITERKSAQDALLDSEDKFKYFFEYSNVAKSFTLPTGEISVNRAFCDLVGYTREELSAIKWQSLTPQEEIEPIQRKLDSLLSGERGSIRFLKRYIHKNGFFVWGDVSVSLRRDRSGKPLHFITAVLDVTKQKEAELRLSAEKERLAVTLRSIGDGVITTDTSGCILTLNKAAEAMTGWQSGEAAGRPLPEVFPIINELTRQPCENPVERVLATGGIVELANHTCLVTRNGREIIIADSGAPIRDNESKIVGVVLVFRDMTEKQKLNDSMQRAQKLESLGVLAGGIAHDFNNLLSGIFGNLDMARESAAAGHAERVPDFITKALGVFERARALTHQLLTFSKGGAPVLKTIRLDMLIRRSAQFALSGSNVACRFAIDDGIWPCDCDENQIGQVIDNVVINAKQAMPMGGEIILSARNVTFEPGSGRPEGQTGDFVEISVIDRGIGMPKDIISRIFDPFFSTKEIGHGLGLATVFSIIKRHDGWIDVDSDPGKGSAFHIFIPASRNALLDHTGHRQDEHRGSGGILVMDDEDFIRSVLADMLRSMGYAVTESKGGEEAIRLFMLAEKTGEPFIACILDLTIPGGMGGEETALELRKIRPDAILIVSSGYSENPVMAKPAEHGFAGSMIKPFRRVDLAMLLNKIMAGSGFST